MADGRDLRDQAGMVGESLAVPEDEEGVAHRDLRTRDET